MAQAGAWVWEPHHHHPLAPVFTPLLPHRGPQNDHQSSTGGMEVGLVPLW